MCSTPKVFFCCCSNYVMMHEYGLFIYLYFWEAMRTATHLHNHLYNLNWMKLHGTRMIWYDFLIDHIRLTNLNLNIYTYMHMCACDDYMKSMSRRRFTFIHKMFTQTKKKNDWNSRWFIDTHFGQRLMHSYSYTALKCNRYERN